MNATITTPWIYLEARPGFLQQLWVTGSAFTASDLYGLYVNAEEPMPIEEIATEHSVPLAAVEEAIAYCQSKPPEIENDFLREETLREASGMNDPNYRGKPRTLSPQEWRRIHNLYR